MLTRLLAHPLTRGLDIDDPATTVLRRTIVQSKPFLRRIYEEWYQKIADVLPDTPGAVLELGSGPGFLADWIPELITSEVFLCEGVQAVLDGQALPFTNDSLRGIVMTNVLHHIPNVRAFFREAARCLRPGGVIAMIEPWVSAWSLIIWTRLHHEPFETDAKDWLLPGNGPLSSANGALPFIVFQRDRAKFEAEFPELQVRTIEGLMPLRYLVSGGVTMRNLMPGFTFPIWKQLELAMSPWMRHLALFALVVVVKRGPANAAMPGS
jgi:SAM-dependent methyltransferase